MEWPEEGGEACRGDWEEEVKETEGKSGESIIVKSRKEEWKGGGKSEREEEVVNCGRCSWQINADEGRDRLIGFSIQKLLVTLTREVSVEDEQVNEQEVRTGARESRWLVQETLWWKEKWMGAVAGGRCGGMENAFKIRVAV